MSNEPPKRWVPKVNSRKILTGVDRKHDKLLEEIKETVPQLNQEYWEKLIEILRAEKKRRDSLAAPAEDDA
jgi:phage regulator Rha-like protein